MAVSYFLLNITNIIYFRHVVLTGWIVHLLLALYVAFSLEKKSAFDEIKGKKGEKNEKVKQNRSDTYVTLYHDTVCKHLETELCGK